MRVFYDLDEIRGRIPNAAVTVGSFDGVHAGHRTILHALADTAAKNHGEGVVVTFDPHPRQVVGQGGVELLNTLEEKLLLLERQGVDNVFVVRFTPEFSRLSPEEFTGRYLFDGIGASSVVTGYNHRFGHDRQGEGGLLESFVEVIRVPRRDVTGQKVSSTVIRESIRRGDLASARRALVDPYFFVAGAGTYDHPEKLFPPDGVYPVTVQDDAGALSETRLPIVHGRPDLSGLPFEKNKLIIRFHDSFP
jgi:riboflavin kinase/FMN adenylyltransferase